MVAAAAAVLAAVVALAGCDGRGPTRRAMGGEAYYKLMAVEGPGFQTGATATAILDAAGVIGGLLGAVLHTDPASAAWLPLDLFPPY